MATAVIRLTVRSGTVDQLCSELGKLQFAGYGGVMPNYQVGGTSTLTVEVTKDLDGPTAAAAKRGAAK
jgi:hypothetical protein